MICMTHHKINFKKKVNKSNVNNNLVDAELSSQVIWEYNVKC